MGRPRPKRGERRIDAAIDHLAEYGFPKPRIRKIINNLLKLYGKDGWIFLEEGSYKIVLETLLEEQEQLEKQQEAAAAADEASLQKDMEVSPAVDSEALIEFQSAVEPQAFPNSSPSQEHVLPPSKGAVRARPPCRGWISEESDTESELEDEEMISAAQRPFFSKKDIPNPAETLPSKRKRPTRWDVRPNNWV